MAKDTRAERELAVVTEIESALRKRRLWHAPLGSLLRRDLMRVVDDYHMHMSDLQELAEHKAAPDQYGELMRA